MARNIARVCALLLVAGCGRAAAPRVEPSNEPAAPRDARAGTAEALVAIPLALERDGRVATEDAREAAVGDQIEAPCEVVAAPDGLATVASTVPARIVAWHVQAGARVRAGDPIVSLQSREVADLRAQIARARIQVEDLVARLAEEQRMLDQGATSGRVTREARTALALARATVDAARGALDVAGATERGQGGTFALRAPLAGTVIRREGAVGALVEPTVAAGGSGVALAFVADLDAARVAAHLPEEASDVAVGAAALVALRGRDGAVPARVVWIDPSLAADTRTRTVHLRPTAPAGLTLQQTGSARIDRARTARGVVVPASAIYREGDRATVFVRRAPGRYAPREVVTGRGGATVEVVSGLAPGEPVVVTGTFLVASEYAQARQERGP